jgi:hypothetical protein
VIVSDLDECYTYTELKLRISMLEINPPPLVEAVLSQKSPEGCPVRRGPVQMPETFLGTFDINMGNMESTFTGKNDQGGTLVMVDLSQSTRKGGPREDNIVVTISRAGATDQKLFGSMIKEVKEEKFRLFDTPRVIVADLDECYTYTELSLKKPASVSAPVEASLTQKSPDGCPVRKIVQMPSLFKGKLEVNLGVRTFTGKNEAGESLVMVDLTDGTRRNGPREDNVIVTITKNGQDEKLFGSRLK